MEMNTIYKIRNEEIVVKVDDIVIGRIKLSNGKIDSISINESIIIKEDNFNWLLEFIEVVKEYPWVA